MFADLSKHSDRWNGIYRPYSLGDVLKLRGSLPIQYTIAHHTAEKCFQTFQECFRQRKHVKALGALTGGQAVQQVKAGLKAIYLSGWQVAADANTAGEMYPDQSLYPVDSVPTVVEKINQAFTRADQIQCLNGIDCNHESFIDYFVPIVADAEAGFGGILNAYELMKHMIQKGAAAVHFEDQLSSVKKCGHLGGKVLVPTKEAEDKLIAARLAADVMGVPTLVIARTDAEAADLLTSDFDERDRPFLTGERTSDGFYRTKKGLDQAIARGIAYAKYADIVWCETGKPDLQFARAFADAIHAVYPEKMLAYNCSPSFNWKSKLSDQEIEEFQEELGKLGYVFQFVTLAGIHSMWFNMFDLAKEYASNGMKAYVDKVQQPEFMARSQGYTFVAHQQEVGTGYFDAVTKVVQESSSVTAMSGSTEHEQF